jgi:hypothetical protein
LLGVGDAGIGAAGEGFEGLHAGGCEDAGAAFQAGVGGVGKLT